MKTYAEYISEKKEVEVDVSRKHVGPALATHKGYTYHIINTVAGANFVRSNPSAQIGRYQVIKRSSDGRHISHGIFTTPEGAMRQIRRSTGKPAVVAEDGGGAAGGTGGAPTTVTAGASVQSPVVTKSKQKKIVGDGQTSHAPARVPTTTRTL